MHTHAVFLGMISSFIFQGLDVALYVQIKAAAVRALVLFGIIYRRAENNYSQGTWGLQNKQVKTKLSLNLEANLPRYILYTQISSASPHSLSALTWEYLFTWKKIKLIFYSHDQMTLTSHIFLMIPYNEKMTALYF